MGMGGGAVTGFEACTCPVCLGVHGAKAEKVEIGLARRTRCEVCGDFVITREAQDDHLGAAASKWPTMRRAALSHSLRTWRDLETYRDTGLPLLTSERLRQWEDQGLSLPLPSEQARNIIRYIGDHERATAKVLERPPNDMYAVVGAPTPQVCWQLGLDLKNAGYLDLMHSKVIGPMQPFMLARLTLSGWEYWERIKRGNKASRDGFIAMQFGDARLDGFVTKTIQPGIAAALNCAVHRLDSPDVARAGIIDNIMREAIQDASFVLVELSHGNKGAYWEAGYAEGLGKPVIYLCEQSVWDNVATRPHFDVNHHTTVMWDEADLDGFVRRLVATIRNSLSRAAG